MTVFILLVILTAPRSTLFPYTTLFRSRTVTTQSMTTLLRAPLIIVGAVLILFALEPRLAWVMVVFLPVEREERSEEHTSELQSHSDLVCRLLLEKKKANHTELTPDDAR